MSKALKPIDEVRHTLTQMSTQFKMALPAHINVDKFVRAAQTAIATSPMLLNMDRTSLLAACMKAAQTGLLCDGSESAIIPFKGKCVFVPMVGGILKLVRNSGELATITSQVVYEKDEFSFWVDSDGDHINHRPNLFEDRGEAIGVYALAKTKDGAFYIEVMTKQEIAKIRAVSPSGENGPWGGAFASEMWRKSAIKRLAKRLPKSTDLENAIDVDNRATTLITGRADDSATEEVYAQEDLEILTERQVTQDPPAQTTENEASPSKEEPKIETPKQSKTNRIEKFLEGKNV